MRIKGLRKLPALFACGQMRLKAARFGMVLWRRSFSGAAFGDSALCGVRPGALPLDSATFEKVDETFDNALDPHR